MKESPRIPVGLPLVWVPRLVVKRVQQLVWQVHQPTGLDARGMRARRNAKWSGHGEVIDPLVLAYAQDCGIEKRPRRRARSVWQVRCSTCRGWTDLLVEAEEGGRWACPVRIDLQGRRGCGPVLRPLEGAMAVYASALRLGLGAYMVHPERGRVLRMGQALAARARTPTDLITLAELAALAGPRPVSWRIPRVRPLGALPVRRYERGPVGNALAPLVIPAAIDTLLHPRAFLARFGARQVRAVA